MAGIAKVYPFGDSTGSRKMRNRYLYPIIPCHGLECQSLYYRNIKGFFVYFAQLFCLTAGPG